MSVYVVKVREFGGMAPTSVFRDFIFAVCFGVCFAMNMAPPSAGQESIRAVPFNIPAQPLTQALDVYARITGMAALVDQELVAGRHSANVKGLLTPDQALRILLAGANLSARYASGGAFTLEPTAGTTVAKPEVNARAGGIGRGRQSYFADLQDVLTQVLCRRPETRPGRYRLGLQLWIGPSGAVLASHLLDSTGDERRDAIITDLLGSATVAAPPAELPQPVTLVLLAHSPEQSPDCRDAGRYPE